MTYEKQEREVKDTDEAYAKSAQESSAVSVKILNTCLRLSSSK